MHTNEVLVLNIDLVPVINEACVTERLKGDMH
jgi:hypothetical protein